MLTGLYLADVHHLQRRQPGDRHRGGPLEAEARRLDRELHLFSGGSLGEGALADAEHLVADLEAIDLAPDSGDDAGDVLSDDREPGRPEPCGEADGLGVASHQVPRSAVEAGRADLDEHLVVLDRGNLDLPYVEDVGAALVALDDGSHPPRRGWGGRRGASGRCGRRHGCSCGGGAGG